jgi:hypothetical protein
MTSKRIIAIIVAALLVIFIAVFGLRLFKERSGIKTVAVSNMNSAPTASSLETIQVSQPSADFIKMIGVDYYPVVAGGHYLDVPNWVNGGTDTSSVIYDGKIVSAGIIDGPAFEGVGGPYIALSDNGQHYAFVAVSNQNDVLYIDGNKIAERPISSGGIDQVFIADNGKDYFYTDDNLSTLFKDGKVVYSLPSSSSGSVGYSASSDGSDYIVSIDYGDHSGVGNDVFLNGTKLVCKNCAALMSQNGQHIAYQSYSGPQWIYHLDGRVITLSASTLPYVRNVDQSEVMISQVTNNGDFLIYGSYGYALYNTNGLVKEAFYPNGILDPNASVVVNNDASRVLVSVSDQTSSYAFMNGSEISIPVGYAATEYGFTGNTLYVYLTPNN